MTEIVLLVALAVSVGHNLWMERAHARERRRLLDAIMARTAGEYVGLIAAEEPRPRAKRAKGEQLRQVGT